MVLLGDNLGEIGGSEYLATMHNTVAGKPPVLDLKREAALQKLIVKLIARRLRRVRARLLGGRIGDRAGRVHVRQRRARRQRRRHRRRQRAQSGRSSVNATLFGESASRIVRLGQQPSPRSRDGGGQGRRA